MRRQCGRCGHYEHAATAYDVEQQLLEHQRVMHGFRGMRVPSGQTTLNGGSL